jgi:hypothetical protein
VDADRFDGLARRLAARRLTRSGVLRGMLAGAAALTGLGALAGGVDARPRKRTVCQCPSSGAACGEARLGRKARRRHLRTNPCSYKGACRGTGTRNPCTDAGAPITININLLGIACTTGGTECGAGTGLQCIAGFCVPIDFGSTCTANDECDAGTCDNGTCGTCDLVSVCESGANAQCCVANADCINGVCVLPDPPGA